MENNLDKLFKSKLEGQEPDFHPSAWDKMEGLLDEAGMVPIQKKKKSKTIFLFILTFGLLVSSAGYLAIDSGIVSKAGSAQTNLELPSNELNKDAVIENNSHENRKFSANSIKSPISNISANSNLTTTTTTKKSTLINTNAKTNTSAKTSTNPVRKINNSEITAGEVNSISQPDNNLGFDKKLTENGSSVAQRNFSIGEVSIINSVNKDPQRVEIDAKIGSTINPEKKETFEHEEQQFITDKQLYDNLVAVNERIPLLAIGALNISNPKSPNLQYPNRSITPQLHHLKRPFFEMGIQSSFRFSDGVGYSIGPYVSYTIGKGYAIKIGVQFDSQNFGAGPEMSVIDKVYSFGSTLNERRFTLNNQKSIQLPLTMSKQFGGFMFSSGLTLNKELSSGGTINSGEVSVEENTIIGSDMIKPTTISFQIGASINLNRHFDLGLGLEFRPKPFSTDSSISYNESKYYPSFVLRYKLFKF